MSDWDSDGDDGLPAGFKQDSSPVVNNGSNWRSNNDDNRSPSRGGFGRGRGRGGGRGVENGSQFRQGNSYQGGEFQRRERRDNNDRDPPLRIEVLNSEIGRIIGKGGENIREIQATSKAHVKIQKDYASLTSTPIDLFGSKEAQEKAKDMINELTSPSSHISVVNQMANGNNNKPSYEPAPRINWAAMNAAKKEYETIRWADLPPVIKHFYFETNHIKNMSQATAESIRKDKQSISVTNMNESSKDRHIPNPVLEFEDAFENYPEILDTIYNAGFTGATPIQSQSWPVLLSGLDMIGIAQTGTGKTLAFLLPAFIHIHGQEKQVSDKSDRAAPNCLVLSPTRELAQQIKQEVEKFHYKGIKSVCIYGGGNRREQIGILQGGVEIVIGTPGRLNDLIMNDFLSVRNVSFLILDEADRMLDMGFEPEIKKILLDIRPDRQTVMTSATWPPDVQRLADQYLKDPVMVNVGSFDLQACHTVRQFIEFVEHENKMERVLEFIEDMSPTDKLLLFVGRKITADHISSDFVLREVDVGVQCIHGGREQCDREQALDDFRTGEARLLIATDVASRGLDIKDITHVINYDFPRHMEEYIHRIGRTGRAGRSGTALTFMTRQDWSHAKQLIEILSEAQQEVPDELVDMAARYERFRERVQREKDESGGGGGGRGGRGGGRGGGGGGGGRGCHRCGQMGHFARDCHQPADSRSNGYR